MRWLKKTITHAAAVLLAVFMCAALTACSGKSVGMKKVLGKPLTTAVTELGNITGKSLSYYSSGELTKNGKTYYPSDESLINFMSGEFTAIDIVETNGAVESVTFYGIYDSKLEPMNVKTALIDCYGSKYKTWDNMGTCDQNIWNDTPDGKVQLFVYDESIFKVMFSA